MRQHLIPLLNRIPSPVACRLGKTSPVAPLLRPLINRLVSPDLTVISVRSGVGRGLKLLADLRCEKYYLTGTYETHVQRALADRLGPGMTLWDVGGHAGFFSLIAARLVGPTGHIHVFEPMPVSRARIEQSVALNGFGNVSIHDCAISLNSGEAFLHSHRSSSMWTIVADRGEETGITIPTRTLDELAEEFGAPDAIKLDVEGAELGALQGGKAVLDTVRPVTFVEFSDSSVLAEGRALLPDHAFERLSDRHWLLT